MELLFKNIEKSVDEKKFGYPNQKGIGFQSYISGEVIGCEYDKDDDGKIKKTQSGNKKFTMAVKVSREIEKEDGSVLKIGEIVYVNCFEKDEFKGKSDKGEFSFPAIKMRDFKPKTKEENGKKVITSPKYVRLSVREGNAGDGFAKLSANPYLVKKGKNKGKINSNIKIQGANLTKVYKEEGKLVYDGFGGKKESFKVDKYINVALKGFFEKIKDTEKFLTKNLDEAKKVLRVRFFYVQSQEKKGKDEKGLYSVSPMVLEFRYNDIEEDVKGQFGILKFLKDEAPGNVCYVKGHFERVGVKIGGDKPKKRTRGFGKKHEDNEYAGYETVVVVGAEVQDEGWTEFDYQPTGHKGDYIIKKDDPVLTPKVEKSKTEKKLEEKLEEDDIDVDDLDVDVDDIDVEDENLSGGKNDTEESDIADIKDDVDDEIEVPEEDSKNEDSDDEDCDEEEVDSEDSDESDEENSDDELDDMDLDDIDFDDLEI